VDEEQATGAPIMPSYNPKTLLPDSLITFFMATAHCPL